MTKINTFVFFDLETTGLPWQEKNQTKIIEFSFVAVLRRSLEVTAFGEMPPVSKLTFAVNPERPIHPDVSKMTGFTNMNLVHAPVFKTKIKSINAFIQDLHKPICLVAHNGNTFDYKIFLAEVNDASASLPEDLLCVDSLVGFRKLLKGTDTNYASLRTLAPTLMNNDEGILTDDDDDWPDLELSIDQWEEIDDLCESLSDISCEDFLEAELQDEKKQKNFVKKKKVADKEKVSQAIKNIFKSKDRNKTICASTTVTSKTKEVFTLSALYKRLLNKEEANAHRAEVDCLMLLECVVALKDEFILWADGACKPLTDIQPLIRYI